MMHALAEMSFCVDLSSWSVGRSCSRDKAEAGDGDSDCLRKRSRVGGSGLIYFGQPFWRLKPRVWGEEEWNFL